MEKYIGKIVKQFWEVLMRELDEVAQFHILPFYRAFYDVCNDKMIVEDISVYIFRELICRNAQQAHPAFIQEYSGCNEGIDSGKVLISTYNESINYLLLMYAKNDTIFQFGDDEIRFHLPPCCSEHTPTHYSHHQYATMAFNQTIHWGRYLSTALASMLVLSHVTSYSRTHR